MRFIKKIILLVVLQSFLVSFAWANISEGFEVKSIQVKGLQRITRDTFDSYLKIAPLQRLTPQKSEQVIRSLYETGFFSNVQLKKEKNTLIIIVTERPTIGILRIHGNSEITTKKLKTVLKSLGIGEGRVYNKAMVNRIKLGLEQQYFNLGYYGVSVDMDVTQHSRGRIELDIEIHEGGVAIIRNVNVLGNQYFTERELLNNFTLKPPNLFSYFTHDDRYSRGQLDGDLQALNAYYLDHGFIDFKILSTQVSLSPDRQNVYITVPVKEGGQYRLRGYEFTGQTVLSKSELDSLAHLVAGDIFSRKAILKANKAILKALGDRGYAFAQVQPVPKVSQKRKSVFVSFKIIPGRKVYVRQIRFIGNYQTNDEVLRRQMRVYEGGLSNMSKLKESKRLLGQLPYLQNISVGTVKVPNADDQLDVNVRADEAAAGSLMAGIGFSQMDGLILNGSLDQKNVFGTGRAFSINLQRGNYAQSYSTSYTNPYYTQSGISRTLSLYYEKTDPGHADQLANYATDDFGAMVSFNIPIFESQYTSNHMNAGVTYQSTILHTFTSSSTQVTDYVSRFGRRFNQLSFSLGWVKNSFDQVLLPKKGYELSSNVLVSAPVDHHSLGYYTLNAAVIGYYPLNDDFIVKARGMAGYGGGYLRNRELPFFRNYFAGGIGSVRGYVPGSLGPKDSRDHSLGGDLSMNGTLALIFPNGLSPDHLRTSVFFDAGNVYALHKNQANGGFDLRTIRMSVGVGAQWVSPFGLLDFSFAKAFNIGNEHTEVFNFSVGANF